jgi:adenosylhomocysteine nucleosidase
MKAKVLVTLADEREFAPWRRLRGFRKIGGETASTFQAEFGGAEVLVALTGVGAQRAAAVARSMAGQYLPCAGIVAGTAGGLKREFRSGDVLVAASVSDCAKKENVRSDPALFQVAVECGAEPVQYFLTVPRIVAKAEDKFSLSQKGDAADMESLGIMKQFSHIGIPGVAVRVIADPAEMDMPCDFEAALDSRGRIRLRHLVAQMARRPQALPGLLRFGLLTHRATVTLARFLDRFVERLAAGENFLRPALTAKAG